MPYQENIAPRKIIKKHLAFSMDNGVGDTETIGENLQYGRTATDRIDESALLDAVALQEVVDLRYPQSFAWYEEQTAVLDEYGQMIATALEQMYASFDAAKIASDLAYASKTHTHTRSQITDFAHTHLWADITDKPTVFTPAIHTHTWAEITNKPSTFAPSAHTHLRADITDFSHTHSATEITSGVLDIARLPIGTGANEVARGNHTHSQYLTSFTEADPTVPSHVKAITTTEKTNWNTAFGWGNHAVQGYLKSYTETDPTVGTHIKAITSGNINDWNTAFGWGNHAGRYSLLGHTHTRSDITNFAHDHDDLYSKLGHTHSNYVLDTDTRLSDARTPTAHTHEWSEITSKQTFDRYVDGLVPKSVRSILGNQILTDDGWKFTLPSGALPTHTHLWAEITDKPTTFAPSAHTHTATDTTAGVFDIARIPTGTTSTTVALGNHTHDLTALLPSGNTNDILTKDQYSGWVARNYVVANGGASGTAVAAVAVNGVGVSAYMSGYGTAISATATSGTAVSATSNATAIQASTSGANSGYAILAENLRTSDNSGIGIWGISNYGVGVYGSSSYSANSIGVLGLAQSGCGIEAQSRSTPLRIKPQGGTRNTNFVAIDFSDIPELGSAGDIYCWIPVLLNGVRYRMPMYREPA